MGEDLRESFTSYPRLVFGQEPVSFLDAWLRLPPDTHAAFSEDKPETDEQMMRLYNLRDTLAETLITHFKGTLIPLEERMVPLTPEDVTLLERWSFRRGPQEQTAYWATVPIGTLWGQVYGGDSCYLHWTLGLMTPGVEDSELKLVWVGTSDNFSREQPTNYDIGIVTTTEWEELKTNFV